MDQHTNTLTTGSERINLGAIRDRLTVIGMAESFFQSSVLFALAKLRIFELIGEADKPLDELARQSGAKPETLARLLNAGVVLNLLETTEGATYRAAPLARSVLLPGAGEAYLGDWIRNLSYFNLAMADLDQAVLKSAPTVDPLTHLGTDAARTREFALAMHDYAAIYGRELAHYLDTTGCRSLLDLGCGPGTYAFYLGMKNPELQLHLLDFPGVLQVAKEVQGRYALPNEVHYVAADALKDEISGQYDLILVSNTLHQLGPDASVALLKRLYKSVKPGGSLVVQARFLRDDRLGDKVPVFLDLLELCITSAGSNHSVAETRGWLEAAGFTNLQFCPMSLFNENSFLRGYRV
jgi:SAM-dependent methyltransferase